MNFENNNIILTVPMFMSFIKGTKTGSIITIKGQITDVGEIMSYMGVAHEIH